MPVGHPSIRVSSDNPLHHLWLNNGTWWVHYTLNFDFRTRRVRRSLGWPGKASPFPSGGPLLHRRRRFPRALLFPTPACPPRPASSDPSPPSTSKEHSHDQRTA